MAKNDFKAFATGKGANVTSQPDWEALPALLSGFTAGKASSAQVNKALRQASFIAAALAQYTASKSGQDVLDDGDLSGFIAKMSAAFGKDFQTLDATLTALAGLATGADKLPYFTGNDTAGQTDLTSVGRDIIGKSTIADILTYLGLVDLVKTSGNNTFAGKQTFTGGVSLPADTAYKGIGLQALFDSKQEKDDTLTALSGKDVAGLLSYLGLTSAAKTDAQNTFTQKQTFSGSVALPSDTNLNGTGLEYLFDSKLDAYKALGTGQTWVDVTASRTSGVTYTNTTTRPICVSIPETADGDRALYVGGVLTAFVRGSNYDSTLFAIVPPGAQYIFSGAFSSWAELR